MQSHAVLSRVCTQHVQIKLDQDLAHCALFKSRRSSKPIWLEGTLPGITELCLLCREQAHHFPICAQEQTAVDQPDLPKTLLLPQVVRGSVQHSNLSSEKSSAQDWLNTGLSGEQLLVSCVAWLADLQSPTVKSLLHSAGECPLARQPLLKAASIFTRLHPHPDQTPDAVNSQSLLQGTWKAQWPWEEEHAFRLALTLHWAAHVNISKGTAAKIHCSAGCWQHKVERHNCLHSEDSRWGSEWSDKQVTPTAASFCCHRSQHAPSEVGQRTEGWGRWNQNSTLLLCIPSQVTVTCLPMCVTGSLPAQH